MDVKKLLTALGRTVWEKHTVTISGTPSPEYANRWTNRYLVGHSIPVPPPANRYVTPPANAPYFDYTMPFLCPPQEVKEELWDAAKAEFDILQQRKAASANRDEIQALDARCQYLNQIMAINADH